MIVFESCGVFSLKEVGLLIYYQLTSAMDSVWTLMYYRYDLRTHQLSHDEILQSYIAFFCFTFCVFTFFWLYVAVLA